MEIKINKNVATHLLQTICSGIAKRLLLVFIILAPVSYATDVNVVVIDAKGNKFESAVVFFEPQFTLTQAIPPVDIVIDQKDKEFIPLVSAIQVGTKISFPNNDKIRHHVYSFSESKSFELPLYKDVEPKPVVFDKAGVIPLGCNIHDWMNAFVFVSKTPYFSMTNKGGNAQIKNLPNGKYLAKLYHPSMNDWEKQAGTEVQVVNIMPTAPVSLTLEKTKKLFRAFRPPTGSGSGGYR